MAWGFLGTLASVTSIEVTWARPQSLSPFQLDALRMVLDDGETARAQRFSVAADRNAFIAAHGLVRLALARHMGQPAALLRFTTAAGGKPEVAGGPHAGSIAFNLAHARSIVACVVAPAEPVGIDVEMAWDATVDAAFFEAAFTAGERAQLAALDHAERPLACARLWTMKEAALKALGRGLVPGVQAVECRLDPPRIVRQPDPARPLVTAVYRPEPRCVLALAHAADARERYPVTIREFGAVGSTMVAVSNSS